MDILDLFIKDERVDVMTCHGFDDMLINAKQFFKKMIDQNYSIDDFYVKYFSSFGGAVLISLYLKDEGQYNKRQKYSRYGMQIQEI